MTRLHELKVDRGLGTRAEQSEAARRRPQAGVHLRGRWVSVAILLGTALWFAGCGKTDSHPLKGVIVDVYAEPPALLVDHEKIPGVMDAMAMRFGVDAATAARVQKGQPIEARMRFQDGKWRLEDVTVTSDP